MLDVLMLTKWDWANTGYRFSKCLERLGLNVMFIKGTAHDFGYPEQGQILDIIGNAPPHTTIGQAPIVIKAPELKPLVEQAKVIHFIASTFIDTGADLSKKKVVVQHGGSSYRKYHEKINEFFNPIVDATIIQCPDLLGLGAKNEHLIYYPVDTEYITPDYDRRHEKILIGHFPSYGYSKGTETVLEVIKELESDKFEYIGVGGLNEPNVPWLENLNRMADCDIIIETIKPNLNGNRFGEWGNTAIEAAALGKIVISNCLSEDVYSKEYGDLRIEVANNGKELKDVLEKLINLNDEKLLMYKLGSRGWVEAQHSIPATAERLYEKVYKELLNA